MVVVYNLLLPGHPGPTLPSCKPLRMPLLQVLDALRLKLASGLVSDLLRQLWFLEATKADDFWDKKVPYQGPKELFEDISS